MLCKIFVFVFSLFSLNLCGESCVSVYLESKFRYDKRTSSPIDDGQQGVSVIRFTVIKSICPVEKTGAGK